MSETAAIESIGKRERTKAANRQAILARRGASSLNLAMSAATVRDIIRGTDLASGTFYNYFRSKEEVYEALADDGARRFRPILRQAREHARDFEDYLHAPSPPISASSWKTTRRRAGPSMSGVRTCGWIRRK
jgi:AcrR family transcriptional regulator